MMKVLVSGGTGYIGSITVEALKKQGFTPIVFDNLVTGHKESISGVKLYEGDSKTDTELLDKIFKEEKPEAVIHFAAWSLVSESMENPQKYFLNNTYGSLNILKSMMKNNVTKFVLSSTAAVYGEPKKVPIDEDDPKDPINPYGESKLMVEKALKWYGISNGLQSVALRYFNACGATLNGSKGEDHDPESHLIPLAIQAALGKRKEFKIFGNDYKTPDGTCIRDYIHVLDLAEAHITALKSFDQGKKAFNVYNVGTGKGLSVSEVVKMVKKVSGVNFNSPFGERRKGDPNQLVAKADKIKKELDWQSKYSDLKTIIESAWKWHKSHPNGYTS